MNSRENEHASTGSAVIEEPHSVSRPNLRVRLGKELLARLREEAALNGMTLTGEIALRLEQSFIADDLEEVVRRTIREELGPRTHILRTHKLRTRMTAQKGDGE